jgi:hypothetical protein
MPQYLSGDHLNVLLFGLLPEGEVKPGVLREYESLLTIGRQIEQ